MQKVTELVRRAAPAPKVQPLAFDGTSFWMGSTETERVYRVDPKSGTVLQEFAAPGIPYGLAVLGNELRAVISIGEDEDRYFFRLLPDTGFDLESKTPCPDFTGSYLASDDKLLYLVQFHNRRILVMTPDLSIQREIPLPTLIGGLGFRSGELHIIAADDEFEDLRLATMTWVGEQPEVTEIAPLPNAARSLAFDGNAWWTNLRDENQTLSFTL